jgi:hypothetical protein
VVEISEDLGDRRSRDDGLSNLLFLHYFQGDFRRGVEVADKLIASALEREERVTQASALQGKAKILLCLEDPDAAVSCLEQSETLLTGGRKVEVEALRTELLGGLAVAHLRRSQRLWSFDHGKAKRDAQLAIDKARLLLELASSSRPSNYGALLEYASPAEVFLTLWEVEYPEPGLPSWARRACAALQSYARVFPIGRPRALLWKGTLAWLSGKRRRAHTAWQESVAAAESLQMPYDQGLAHFEIGRHLADGDGARLSHLEQARDLFGALGVDRHPDSA